MPTVDPTETVPAPVRTWCYITGTVLGLGVAPAMLAIDRPALAGVAAAVAGAANAIAFGYRPTRGHG